MQQDTLLSRAPGHAGLFLIALCLCAPAHAQDPVPITVKLKNHQFEPAEIHVQAGKPTVLLITNEDETPEEIDSTALKIEKAIPAGHHATIRLRPLGPGRYPFMGEHHPDTATAVVVSE